MNYRRLITHVASGGLFVNVYDQNEAYGGPEEGGWYYTQGRFLEGVPASSPQQAEEIRERLKAKYSGENDSRRPAGSIMLHDPHTEIPDDWEPTSQADDESHVYYEGKIVVRIEDRPGKDFPEERPYYE